MIYLNFYLSISFQTEDLIHVSFPSSTSQIQNISKELLPNSIPVITTKKKQLPELMHFQLKEMIEHHLNSHLGWPLYFHLMYSYRAGFHCSDQIEMLPSNLIVLCVIHQCKFHSFLLHQPVQVEAVVLNAYEVFPSQQTEINDPTKNQRHVVKLSRKQNLLQLSTVSTSLVIWKNYSQKNT